MVTIVIPFFVRNHHPLIQDGDLLLRRHGLHFRQVPSDLLCQPYGKC